MSVVVLKVLFNEELGGQILLGYQDARTIPTIKNMIQVAIRCKSEHSMNQYQKWLLDLVEKVKEFEDVLHELVQGLHFDKIYTGMQECIHEERINNFVCLALIRLVKTQEPKRIMESGIVTLIARSMRYWEYNVRVQNYWIYCLLHVNSSFSHYDIGDPVFTHTFPITAEINKYDVQEILETGIIDSVLSAMDNWYDTPYTLESGMKFMFKIFCQSEYFESRECLRNKPIISFDRDIGISLRVRMASIILCAHTSRTVTIDSYTESQLWYYSMTLLIFLISKTAATTKAEWANFLSLRLTLLDSSKRYSTVIERLSMDGTCDYLMTVLNKLVNNAADPKNVCQTVLALGLILVGNEKTGCQLYKVSDILILLKLYQNIDIIFRDCDTLVPSNNGTWLYNTTYFYVVVILLDIAAKFPSKMLSLREHRHYPKAHEERIAPSHLHEYTKTEIQRLHQTMKSLTI